jgi:predicted acetyltransferase
VDLQFRFLTPDEVDPYLRATVVAFGARETDEGLVEDRKEIIPERTMAAMDGDAFVGGAAAYPFRMSVPGADGPMTGIVSVWTAPTHRRRGVATALMRRQLDDLHDRGEAITTLWATEGAIYGRFGYGIGAFSCGISIERARNAFGAPVPEHGAIRLVEREEFLRIYPPLYERARAARPGMVSRDDVWIAHRFHEHEGSREISPTPFFAVLVGADGAEGYAAYHVKPDWEAVLPSHKVRVDELIGVTPEATASLWRFCLDLDLVALVEADNRPIDDPLFHLLAEPRALQLTVRDGMWVRLVDVRAALAARRYASEGRVVLEVRDDFCSWNDGRVALEGGPEGAECVPTDEEPDLLLTVAELGAAYLGGTRLEALATAGRVRELRDGALEKAGSMFGAAPAPWSAHIF